MSLFRNKKIFDHPTFSYVLEIDLPLIAFDEYIKATDDFIESIDKKLKKNEEFLEKATREEIEQLFDYIEHEISRSTYHLYFRSMFISMYSFLERKTYQLCKLGEHSQTLKIKDLSGEGVNRCYRYLKKVLNVDMALLNSQWQEIKKYNLLRNELVHNPTSIIEDTKENATKIQILKSIKELSVSYDDDGFIFTIDDISLLHEFQDTTDKFLSGIYYED